MKFETKELQEAIAKLTELTATFKIKKETKADMGETQDVAPETESEDCCECCDCCEELEGKIEMLGMYMDYLNSSISNVYKYVSSVESALYNHTSNGHIPPVKGADKMNEVLSILNLDGDYEAQKQTVWAKNGDLEVDISSKLKK